MGAGPYPPNQLQAPSMPNIPNQDYHYISSLEMQSVWPTLNPTTNPQAQQTFNQSNSHAFTSSGNNSAPPALGTFPLNNQQVGNQPQGHRHFVPSNPQEQQSAMFQPSAWGQNRGGTLQPQFSGSFIQC